MCNIEEPYLEILKKVLNEGEERPDRTGTGTRSMFGLQTRFDISSRVPCLTSKFVPWKMIIKELLWFLRGDTDVIKLQEQNVHIWDGNSSREFLDARGLKDYREGDIGPGYGFQWRHFGAEYHGCRGRGGDIPSTSMYDGKGIDQISGLIENLKKDPFSRRHFISAWNPKDLNKMALPPCHVSAQFYVSRVKTKSVEENTEYDESKDKMILSCHLYQRSVDLFLGFPFNILSYTALTYLLCKLCDFTPGKLIVSMGDSHIYNDHIEQSKCLLERPLFDSPILEISDTVKEKTIDELCIDDFALIDYNHSGKLLGRMS